MEHFQFCAVLYNNILETENQEKTSGMRISWKQVSASNGVQLFTTFSGTNTGQAKVTNNSIEHFYSEM